MPSRVVVSLEPKVVHPHGPPLQTGPAIHAAVLHAVRRLNPDVSALLHRHSRNKPFAVTPLLDRSFEVGVLGLTEPEHGDAVAQQLAEAPLTELIVEALAATPELRVGHSSFLLRDVTPYTRSWRELVREAPSHRWRLRFLTPTTFRHDDRQTGVRRAVPLPATDLVFGWLLRRWQRCARVPLPSRTAAVVRDRLRIEEHTISTHPHLVKPGVDLFTGFLGDVTYGVSRAHDAPTDSLRGIGALVWLALFGGVGDYTTKGMGCVRLLPSPSPFRRAPEGHGA